MSGAFKVYIEVGTRRTFAGAIDWPGWSRSGRDEAAALQALLDYSRRYARVLRGSSLAFKPPEALAELRVVERLKGGTGTDFGAPEVPPSSDERKMDIAEWKRSATVLSACWAALDDIARAATGRTLRTGPRGGGRSLREMLEHVRGADEAYIERLGWWKFTGDARPKYLSMDMLREAAFKGIQASAAGKIPPFGPRGGKRWSARYFVRRAAWHVLDHAWEIEDRLP